MELLQTDEKKLILKSPLFRGISEAELSGVLEGLSAQRRTFRREAPVFLWGETTGMMGIVLKGSVRILQEDFWGNSTILALSLIHIWEFLFADGKEPAENPPALLSLQNAFSSVYFPEFSATSCIPK